MKFLRIFLLFIPFVSAVVIKCQFEKNTYLAIGSVYECNHKSNSLITSPNIVIISANGDHYNLSMNHEKVASFRSDSSSQTIHYMPHGLNKIFPNLIAIIIWYGRIKEIHQKDLEQYSKLRYFNLDENDITYLEKDLFKFNTQLQFINLQKNKINQIYPTIFDHLNQLEYLWLDSNQCINKRKGDRSGVLELIKEIKDICWLFTIFDRLNNADEKSVSNWNQLNEKSSNLESKMENMMEKQDEKLKKSESNLNQKVESTANKITDEIQTLMKQQEKNSMTKLDEQLEKINQNLKELKNQFESEILKIKNGMSERNDNTQDKISEQYQEMNQKLVNLLKNLFNQFFFIGLPFISLFTSLNIAMIYLCCRKHAKIGKVKKSSPSNDVELEDRNL
ncbi:hypothetical protein PVAND_016218 [Polypedilum vanderplanki]|uniref:Uncharacterized protein n=1 Tax=Polypedilum vanderplanki TaxID=319348 RepID=A0A9J6BF80_POLVA|nr:hypothetical protein PVAND_016218 [Polypedilum vanderplanki]